MKKLLSVIGGIFIILIIAVAGFVGYAMHEGDGLDASSKAYVDDNVPPIISTWSKEELLKRASPQLIRFLNERPEQTDQIFQKFSQLGALRSYDGSKGDSHIHYTIKDGKVITASYVATAKFENGEADIIVRLIRISGQWQLLYFDVDLPPSFSATSTSVQSKASLNNEGALVQKTSTLPPASTHNSEAHVTIPTMPPPVLESLAPVLQKQGHSKGSSDLRYCLELKTNAEITSCANK